MYGEFERAKPTWCAPDLYAVFAKHRTHEMTDYGSLIKPRTRFSVRENPVDVYPRLKCLIVTVRLVYQASMNSSTKVAADNFFSIYFFHSK